MKKHYVYRHLRKDTGKPFYIGIGTKHKEAPCNHKSEFRRAFQKTKRTDWWKAIISKHGYNVEILIESDDYDFIKEKEKEFINLYGRCDKDEGTLVNLTDGGDGSLGLIHSEQTKQKISELNKGYTHTKEAKKKIREAAKNRSQEHINKIAKKIAMSKRVKVKRLSTGEVYNSINECADAHNVSYATIGRWCEKQDSDFKRLQPKIEYNREKYIHADANITLEEAKDVLRLIKKEEDLSPKEIQRRTDADYQTIKDMKYKGRYSWVLDE